ncbi:MAG: S-methyl-5'-thioadenosine phosphorylase [Anaerolineae bacterium]
MAEARIAIIGGSGLYEMEGLSDVTSVRVETPFGDPSDALVLGTLEDVPVAFLPRHGVGHRINPAELPSRANIYALKSLGVERIITVTACGSLKEGIAPQDIVIPDQIIHRTAGRPNTFFDRGIVAHVAFDEPFCPDLSAWLREAGDEVGAEVHLGGTFLVIEGPQFSTKAESAVHRRWGTDIVGMTAVPEAKLAREAEICYAALANVTDYDVWHEDVEPVTQEMVALNVQKNVAASKAILRAAIPRIAETRPCVCATALEGAIATDPALIPKKRREELALLLDRYLS